MKLGIGKNSLRFRISAEDFERLICGEKLATALHLGGGDFYTSILPVEGEGRMQAAFADNGISLSVSQGVLSALRDLGRSKEGVSVKQGDTVISLQIDLKTVPRQQAG